MLIYAYADILGYRSMIKTKSSSEVYNVLNEAVSEMHRILSIYTNSKSVTEAYREGILYQHDYVKFDSNNKMIVDKSVWDYASNKEIKLKLYIAFDTIVIYWDEFEISPENMMIFLLAIDLFYLILYDRDIMIRGAIGTSDDYYIDEVGNERYFIIDNIDIAAAIEKNQDASNIIVFGKKIEQCFWGTPGNGLVDDYYERLDYYLNSQKRAIIAKRHPYSPRLFFKKGFVEKVLNGTAEVQPEDIFNGYSTNPETQNLTCITICPINNLSLFYLGVDFYERLYKKVKTICYNGYRNGYNHVDELKINTACLLFSRLKSDIFNASFLSTVLKDDIKTELPIGNNNVNDMWAELNKRLRD